MHCLHRWHHAASNDMVEINFACASNGLQLVFMAQTVTSTDFSESKHTNKMWDVIFAWACDGFWFSQWKAWFEQMVTFDWFWVNHFWMVLKWWHLNHQWFFAEGGSNDSEFALHCATSFGTLQSIQSMQLHWIQGNCFFNLHCIMPCHSEGCNQFKECNCPEFGATFFVNFPFWLKENQKNFGRKFQICIIYMPPKTLDIAGWQFIVNHICLDKINACVNCVWVVLRQNEEKTLVHCARVFPNTPIS